MRHPFTSWLAIGTVVAFLAFVPVLSHATSTTFTVVNTNDSGPGSLRQAIVDANGNAGTDTIAFTIPGGGPYTIQPLSALPVITDPVVIDGTTQPGFAGSPIIELDGTNAPGAVQGLAVTAGNSVIRGLIINRFSRTGIVLNGGGYNVIEGNYIGTDVTGTVALGNGLQGISAVFGSGLIV